MYRFLLPAVLLFVPLCPQDKPDTRPTGPVVGKPAPAFRLNDHTGKLVSVGGASKTFTVLAFYPKAATPG